LSWFENEGGRPVITEKNAVDFTKILSSVLENEDKEKKSK
jgi:hypothetical protein